MTGTTATITDVPAEFQELLWPGDVLVYDSITHADAGLVQWADAAPVNHASLVLDADCVIEANHPGDEEPCPEHQGDADPRAAVHTVRLGPRLDLPGVRTVTALRHVDVERRADARRVVESAVAFLGRGGFSYLDIVVLVPAGLKRAYPHDLNRGGVLAGAFRQAATLAAELLSQRKPTGPGRLTCSEFAYRCFRGAGLPVTVERPLLTYPRPGIVPTGPPKADWMDEADAAALEALLAQLRSDPPIRHFVEPPADAPRPGEVVPDAVSPGDLWRSNSLEPVAVLHHPPQRRWRWPGETAPPAPAPG